MVRNPDCWFPHAKAKFIQCAFEMLKQLSYKFNSVPTLTQVLFYLFDIPNENTAVSSVIQWWLWIKNPSF